MRTAFLPLMVLALAAQAQPARWTLPTGLAVKQTGPQSWRFVCDYFNLDRKGGVLSRDRYSGLYTSGLADGTARWSDVTHARNADGSAKFSNAEKREFMEGFSYSHPAHKRMLEADFFHGFPPTAMQERNLVWDTEMIESFGQRHFERLALNTPYRVPDADNVPLAGLGAFHHKELELEWTGISKRNNEECAVIDYRAFFNQFEVSGAAVNMTGRSHYWGQIWVSLTTKRIEYATLYEDVLGELKVAGQATPVLVNVLRIGTFQPAVN